MKGHNTFISNPFSTGGGGPNFEIQVQASFVALMLAGGFAPCLPLQPIQKVKLQGSFAGFGTDDIIVFTGDGPDARKLLGQIRRRITMTEASSDFGEVIRKAWTDFNNPKVFSRGKDVIALITGPLSATDIEDVRTLLEWARYSESAQEFFDRVETTVFSSDAKRRKLQAFRRHLDAAQGSAITDEDIYIFLHHFHLLGYDLDIKSGVMHAVLHSLIGSNSQKNPSDVLARIVHEVMYANQNAGIITRSSLPEDLRAAFTGRAIQAMPEAVSETIPPRSARGWNNSEFAPALVVANLAGSWDEQSEADMAVIRRLVDGPFDAWQMKIRQVLQLPDSPLSLRNGVWTVKERGELWQVLGSGVFDNHLDMLKECALTVLMERDPQFELDRRERFAASIHGKVLTHSNHIRRGLAESLALVGSRPAVLTNCSLDKPEATAILTIRQLLEPADWILWGSLNDLLPTLAEASPQEFLRAVENATDQTPCPFDELFAQEGSGFGERNYLTGLLWALESIAWDEEYLVRASVALGSLADRDPGGQWANRPLNSLVEIFLPWLPQTTASVDKRKIAIQTLCREAPVVAWKLLLSLLPGETTISGQTCRPKWRRVIPDDWKDEVTQRDYWTQVTLYAGMAEQMAVQDISKLEQLVANMDSLPLPTFEKILEHIASDQIADRPEDERLPLWTALVELASKHRRFPDAKWAFPDELVTRIETTAQRIEPKSLQNQYRRLFCGRDWDLYEEDGDWQEQGRRLEQRRQQVIQEILRTEGFEAVIRFAESVESPEQVGFSLGSTAAVEVDSALLPSMLVEVDEKHTHLAAGFIRGRFQQKGWSWVDETIKGVWSKEQIGRSLSLLPFVAETWRRVSTLLREDAAEYWQKVSVNPYQAEGDLYIAIDNLIEHGRPWAAIDCLAKYVRDRRPLEGAKVVRALLDAVSSEERYDTYDAIQLIKALQEDPHTSEEDLFKIEWAYLPLLKGHRGAEPKYLATRLARDPEFFCELIRIVYRSNQTERSQDKTPESHKVLAQKAFRLLGEWRTPPGTISQDEFSGETFKQWIHAAIESASKSGHLKPALSHIGRVLIHSPGDPDGLSLHRAVAEVLNAREFEGMRRGFRVATYNSRGVHWVDPTGKPELELADKYWHQAEEMENAGYQRLATTLRGISESYKREAKQIIEDHKNEEREDEE